MQRQELANTPFHGMLVKNVASTCMTRVLFFEIIHKLIFIFGSMIDG